MIDILTKMQKICMSSNIYLELNPFESGVLTAVLSNSLNEPVVNDIYNRLVDICIHKYYED